MIHCGCLRHFPGSCATFLPSSVTVTGTLFSWCDLIHVCVWGGGVGGVGQGNLVSVSWWMGGVYCEYGDGWLVCAWWTDGWVVMSGWWFSVGMLMGVWCMSGELVDVWCLHVCVVSGVQDVWVSWLVDICMCVCVVPDLFSVGCVGCPVCECDSWWVCGVWCVYVGDGWWGYVVSVVISVCVHESGGCMCVRDDWWGYVSVWWLGCVSVCEIGGEHGDWWVCTWHGVWMVSLVGA